MLEWLQQIFGVSEYLGNLWYQGASLLHINVFGLEIMILCIISYSHPVE